LAIRVTAVQLTPPALRLSELPAISKYIERLHYSAIWIGEVNILDSVVPASIVACHTDSILIGPLFNVYTRAPTNVALSGSGLAHAAPGRVALVLGASSPVLVERWNGIAYVRPYDRVSDYLKFLRAAFSGERVKAEFRTFTSSGFSLDDPPLTPPRVFVAAAMPRMMALASDQADGVVLNWVAPHDLDHFDSLRCPRDRVWLSMIVCPTTDRTFLDSSVRPLIADYLAIPAYANLQRRAGREPALASMWERWATGDRSGARSQLPNSVIDELIVSGEPEECGRWIRSAERRHGIQIIATVLMPESMDYHDVLAKMSLQPKKQ
jgi:alkanesulfonate monooxygenase SsuD/methylene tetrahydromethanopterin reductase-like flavin-dependent oxidoreductase (luciferase family)